MSGQHYGKRVFLQCSLSRVEILAPGKGRPRGGAAAVPEEPPPSRVRSDLQASLTGWGFCPTEATFGSARRTGLGIWTCPALSRGGGGGARALLASSCPVCKGTEETKPAGQEQNAVAKRGPLTLALCSP